MKQGRRTVWWWVLRTLAVFAAIILTFVVLYFLPDSRIVVSRETTYLSEPLDKEGNVDYLAAINQRAAEGVTPENNAAVLYWQALGPSEINEVHREEFFRWLGMDPLPAEGEYFLSLDRVQQPIDQQEEEDVAGEEWDAMKARHKRRDERRNAMEYTPWVSDDDPLLAEWLEDNQQSIDLFIAGTLRTKHFVPDMVFSQVEQQDWSLYPVASSSRYVVEYHVMGRAMMLRSMLNNGNGRPQEAWNDCLACFRLAQHTTNRPHVLGALVSYTENAMAAAGVPMILHEGDFTADELTKMRQEFREVATCASVIEAVNWGERLMGLDYIQSTSRESRRLRGSIDWNQVLRDFNNLYDRMVAEMKRGSGESDLMLFEQDFESLGIEFRSLMVAYPFSRRARSRMMAIQMESLLTPAFSAIMNAELRCKCQLERIDVVFALSLYRAQHQEYPENLAALVPSFLDEVPLDPFDPMQIQPVRYRRQADGYSLWSVGRNGIDDGGRTRQDWEDIEEAEGGDIWDDEVFRVPRRLQPMTDTPEPTEEEAPAGEITE